MEEFSRRVSPRLVGSLALQCGSRPLAEDLAQEAMARTWENWSEVREMPDPERWTYRVAFNLTASAFRRRAAERRASHRSHERAAAVGDESVDRLALRGALQSLPSRQRQAIVLRYYRQLSAVEAAQVMGCAAGTVRALTSQALAALRESFEFDVDDQRTEADRA
jgi:RNA polymerase sigma factor (sigma-70 family)